MNTGQRRAAGAAGRPSTVCQKKFPNNPSAATLRQQDHHPHFPHFPHFPQSAGNYQNLRKVPFLCIPTLFPQVEGTEGLRKPPAYLAQVDTCLLSHKVKSFDGCPTVRHPLFGGTGRGGTGVRDYLIPSISPKSILVPPYPRTPVLPNT